uniref:FGENESH: predicted gene_9.481 protein n=1 Tax=Rhodotorula toruloides TaxID=5286 RepID=A0A0K3CI15_RHOTO
MKSSGALILGILLLSVSHARCAATELASNALCRSKGPAAPTNAQSFCISGSCTFRCNDGYAPGGPDGTQCVASQIQCGGTVCTIPQYGYATCNTDGTCNIGCEAGYERYLPNADSSGPYSCFDTLSDPSNCGMPGHACPDSCASKSFLSHFI